MPHLDGHTIITEIRQSEKEYRIPEEDKAKIMMVTSLSDPVTIQKAYEFGCDAYVVKPVDSASLCTEMEKLGFF